MKKNYKRTNTAEPKNPALKNDYQMNLETAQKIIEIIESGNVQAWKRTWITTETKTILEIYNLVANEKAIAVNAQDPTKVYKWCESGFYLTFKQIKSLKLHLTKGSKGTPHYKPTTITKFLTKNEITALEALATENEKLSQELELLKSKKINKVYVSFKCKDTNGNDKEFKDYIYYNNNKYYYMQFMYVLEYLFRVEDCGYDVYKAWNIAKLLEEPSTANVIDTIEHAEEVKSDYVKRAKLEYKEIYQESAFYVPAKHSVTLPLRSQFESSQAYYETMFHEFAHSTGHESLLNRKTLTASCGFGSVTYSKEELVAELSSLYTMEALNLATDELFQNSIAYLRSWGAGLKEGIKHNIMSTIAQSRKATNLILNIEEKKGAKATR